MFKIGQLARLADVTPDTIRFYEKQGMMDHNQRSHSGYRLYDQRDLQRLRFIRHAKQLGFKLETITELLSIRIEPSLHTCQESKAIVDSHLYDVEKKIDELSRIRDSLKKLSDACCGGAHASTSCSIMEIIEQGHETNEKLKSK